jgi:predicted permease
MSDLQGGLRFLNRNRGFAAGVVLILALGIGANSAVFSLVNAILLKDLPVDRPEELVWFGSPSFSYPIFQEVRARSGDLFSGLFAWNIETVSVEWGQEVRRTPALFVSGEFYPALRISPVHGRLLTPQDDWPAAVISYACWERRFQRDPAIVGKTIRVERTPFTIVGVTPPGFYGVAPGLAPEFMMPLALLPKLKPEDADLRKPHMAWLHLMGRLKPGLSLEQANSAVQVFWPQVMESVTDPAMPRERRARFLARRTELMPGRTGFSRVRRQFTEPLLLLFGLVGLLLLAASATVAHLMLVRGWSRRREFAVRLALGAGRKRLIRQLLAEGLLLALLAALAGMLLASWGSDVLVALLATAEEPVAVELTPDLRFFAFLLAAVLLTAVLFTLAPAFRATAVDPGPALKESARTLRSGARRWGLGKALAISQVALAVLLLAGAALFTRSLHQLVSLDPGFDHRRLLVVSVDGFGDGGRVEKGLRAVPGVKAASLVLRAPLSDGAWTDNTAVDGAPPPVAGLSRTYFNAVSPGYFATLGQPLVRGRDFRPQDTETCVVSESLARAFFPNQDPIGRRISVGLHAERQKLEIIGIVRDAKYQNLQEPTRRIAYLPYRQTPNPIAVVRTEVRPASLTEPIRRELLALEPSALVRVEALTERIRESLVTERVVAVISVFLGAAAVLLASAGLYGLLRYTVSRRTGEIGLRIALGATRAEVQWMVLKDALAIFIPGLAAGLLAALALGRFTANLIYGITPRDPVALAAAGSLMFGIALAASWLPARRAARVDPMEALRHE